MPDVPHDPPPGPSPDDPPPGASPRTPDDAPRGTGGPAAAPGDPSPTPGEPSPTSRGREPEHAGSSPPPPVPPPAAVSQPPPAAVDQPPRPGAESPPPPGLDDRDRTLDPRVVNVWRIATAVVLLLPLVPGSVVAVVLLGRLGALVPLAGLLLLAVLSGWYPRARWDRWRWRLTPLALELRHGVLVRTHEALPYFRVQQIDVNQGPLDRLLGLASLQVTTASASGSGTLPGIAVEQAPAVRAELLARASQAVAEHQGEVSDAV